jgi:hypothetical protein
MESTFLKQKTSMDPMIDPEHYQPLKQAVDALASVCDGANARDDEGFDGADTRAGHLLAFLPLSAWPNSAFHRAWRWTRKYHRQLEAMSIDCSGVSEPPECEGEDRHIALVTGGTRRLYVVFPFDEALIAAFRRIPGNQLHTVPIGQNGKLNFRYRTVSLQIGMGEALLAFASEYGFTLCPEVVELAQEASDEEQPAEAEVQHEFRVGLEEGGRVLALYFPRIEALNNEVKTIPGRRATSEGGFHWLVPALPRSIDALNAFLQLHPQFFISEEARHALGLQVETYS